MFKPIRSVLLFIWRHFIPPSEQWLGRLVMSAVVLVLGFLAVTVLLGVLVYFLDAWSHFK